MHKVFFDSPLGAIEICAAGGSIVSISFVSDLGETIAPSKELETAMRQLSEYFSGNRREFDLLLAPVGTEFQKQVWKELQSIPFGEKKSYLDIATGLGNKNLTRAVGAANGKNPIAIVIPCHRVIGEDGKLTGYAGGLWRKEWLLDMESPSKQENLF
jgi:methylated-DNA-[protein]-cysteine S-methyltransferase